MTYTVLLLCSSKVHSCLEMNALKGRAQNVLILDHRVHTYEVVLSIVRRFTALVI